MSYYPSFLDEETEVQSDWPLSPVRHQQSKPLASLVLGALNLRGSYLGVSLPSLFLRPTVLLPLFWG